MFLSINESHLHFWKQTNPPLQRPQIVKKYLKWSLFPSTLASADTAPLTRTANVTVLLRWDQTVIGVILNGKNKRLTHLQPMFDVRRNQVVGFYYQNVWKAPVEEWHFGSKNQIPGLSIIGTLVENGLKIRLIHSTLQLVNN